MSREGTPLIGRVCHNRRGQVLILVAVMLVGLIGMLAFVIDIGHILNARRQLQAMTDAAATAGAQDLPDATAAKATAIAYSAMAGRKNFRSNLLGVAMPATGCRFGGGSPCVGILTSTGLPVSAPNAIQVKQQVTLQSFFAQVLGISSVTITATATASMRGGVPRPIDAIIIVDATASMDATCTASVPGVSSPTRLDCAKDGVRAFLSSLWPCAPGLPTCGSVTNGHVVNPVDEVGFIVFPGLKSTTPLSVEFDCASNLSSSQNAAYGSSPAPVYLIVGLSSDYRTSSTSGLNGAGSNLVKAVDWTDGNTCTSSHYGVESPGGEGTYYVDAINQAQTTLVSTGRANVQKVIILLSDGDANKNPTSNPCHGAITAAQNAKTAGTWVYSIAYGADSGGCGLDSPSISSLQTMQQIATDATKFFNQPNAAELVAIFKQIAFDLTTTRLLDDATP